jgi:hypothetical protein
MPQHGKRSFPSFLGNSQEKKKGAAMMKGKASKI